MQEAAGTCKVGEKLVSEWNAMIQAGKLPTSSATACNTIIWLDINYDEVPFDLASALDLARHLARRAEIDGSEIGSWQSHATLAHDRLNMIVSRLCGR